MLAILEGRGMGKEVGIAALDKDTGRVNLIQVRIHLRIHPDNCVYNCVPIWQLSDVPTYVKTLHQMHLHYPSLVLVPDTFLSLSDASLVSGGKRPNTTSVLVQSILEEFDSVPVEPVLRKYWSDTAGKVIYLVAIVMPKYSTHLPQTSRARVREPPMR